MIERIMDDRKDKREINIEPLAVILDYNQLVELKKELGIQQTPTKLLGLTVITNQDQIIDLS